MTRVGSWEGWIDEAVALMDRRNDRWEANYGLSDAPFSFSLAPPELAFERAEDEVVADICVVGTAEHDGPFVWGWANTSVAAEARVGLKEVRRFGATHSWSLLMDPQRDGGPELGHSCVAVAGRVLDAEGVFVHDAGDVVLFFALSNFRTRPKQPR